MNCCWIVGLPTFLADSTWTSFLSHRERRTSVGNRYPVSSPADWTLSTTGTAIQLRRITSRMMSWASFDMAEGAKRCMASLTRSSSTRDYTSAPKANRIALTGAPVNDAIAFWLYSEHHRRGVGGLRL